MNVVNICSIQSSCQKTENIAGTVVRHSITNGLTIITVLECKWKPKSNLWLSVYLEVADVLSFWRESAMTQLAASTKGNVAVVGGLIGIFRRLDPSGCIMTLVSTQSPGGKRGRCVGLTTLSPSCVNCLEILGASTVRSPEAFSKSV
jgi:hypothetical protein